MNKKEQKLTALFDAVIVLPFEDEEESHGSIIVPDLGKDINKKGTVVDVGPGSYSVMGNLIPTRINIGDVVVLPTMGFTRFEFKGQEYFIGPEKQILAVIK